jgi:gliding motility-associated-like protein
MRFNKRLFLFFLGLSNLTYSQCNWTQAIVESFEYTSIIPGLVSGTTYHNTPQLQSFANCVRSGSRGMYMNIVDGYSGLLYNRATPPLCVGATYRYKFSVRDAFSSSNNLTFNVVDANNTILLTQTIITNSTWQDITMPSFVATTPIIRFQIITNTPGGPGNDVGFDDLIVEVCNYSKQANVTQCQANGPVSLFAGNLTSISSQNGVWTGPSALQNGYIGTFTPGVNPNGNYVYTLDGGNNCPDSIATIAVFINSNTPVNLGPDTTLCNATSYLLNPGTGYTSYLWHDGTTTTTKNVTQSGTYHVKVGTIGPNMIVNSGFESGNTGFTTSYSPGVGGTWGLLSNPGTYAITTSPNLVHSNFSSCQDHTVAPGVNMLVVNGASTPNTQVWCQTVTVEPATTYQFGTWVTSALTDPTVAQLQFSINGAGLGSIFSPTSQGCNWTQFTQNWTSGLVTSAQICIVNQNTSGGGNDFALDDITFRPICYTSDTVVVSFSPNPIVNLGNDITICSTDSILLNAQNNGSTYQWNTGVSSQTIQINTAGTYSVVVTNAAGCSASDQFILTTEPIKSAGNDSIATICSTQANFNLVSIRDNAATVNGNWYTTNFVGTLNANGTVTTVNTPGQFDFQYVVSGVFCPNDTADFELTINQQPVALANSNVQFCNTPSALESLVTNFNNGSSYTTDWAYSTINLEFAFNEATQQLSVGNLNGGQYNIYQFLIADSTCQNDTTNVFVNITQIPQVDFNSSVIEGCEPLSVTFFDVSNAQGNLTYFWDFGNGQTSTTATGNTIVYPTPNCYTVSLTVTADNLCTITNQKPNMICVYEIPNADFSFAPQQVFSHEPFVQFNNLSTLNAFNFWSFGDGSFSSIEEPSHDFPLGDVGDYIVILQITSIHGCVDTVSHVVTIKDQLLFYVPNTFTPDGDEHNNVFEAIVFAGVDKDEISFEIYNRWGEVVFKTSDVTEGWDGTFNGLKCPEGSYAWVLRLGLSESEDVKIVNGAVNLIR